MNCLGLRRSSLHGWAVVRDRGLLYARGLAENEITQGESSANKPHPHTDETITMSSSGSGVHRVDMYVSADDIDTIKRLAIKIKPEWSTPKDIKIKDMSGGYINRNVCCYRTTVDDGLFFRMLSEEGTIVDQGEALKVIEFLHEQGLCAPLRMVFKNGWCVDYISGDGLTWATRHRQYEPKIRKAIAHEMACYHSQKAHHVAQEFRIAEEYSFLGDDLITPCWDYMAGDENIDQSLVEALPSLETFRTERDAVIRMMSDIQLEKAFCHTDINPSNIIMVDHGERALFVDYDFCRLSYKAIDITWFFICFVDMLEPNFSQYPDAEYRHEWLREYLQAQWEVDGRQRPLTEHKFKLLRFQVTKAHLWALLEFMYAMLFVTRLGPPSHVTRNDLLRSAKRCWDTYLSQRDEVMSLKLEDMTNLSVSGITNTSPSEQ